MDLWYKVHRGSREEQNGLLSGKDVRKHGFLQFRRLEHDYKMHLRSLFLERLQEMQDPKLREFRLESSLEEIVAARPMLVHWLMSVCRWIHAVQHSVYVSGEPGRGVMLRIATLRKDPSRYLAVYTRHQPEIASSV